MLQTPFSNDFADGWKADGIKHYVDWAAKEGFGIMDVNIPKFITAFDGDGDYSNEDKAGRSKAMNELAVYLWENYIE
jgi:histone deacetylase 6